MPASEILRQLEQFDIRGIQPGRNRSDQRQRRKIGLPPVQFQKNFPTLASFIVHQKGTEIFRFQCSFLVLPFKAQKAGIRKMFPVFRPVVLPSQQDVPAPGPRPFLPPSAGTAPRRAWVPWPTSGMSSVRTSSIPSIIQDDRRSITSLSRMGERRVTRNHSDRVLTPTGRALRRKAEAEDGSPAKRTAAVLRDAVPVPAATEALAG